MEVFQNNTYPKDVHSSSLNCTGTVESDAFMYLLTEGRLTISRVSPVSIFHALIFVLVI